MAPSDAVTSEEQASMKCQWRGGPLADKPMSHEVGAYALK